MIQTVVQTSASWRKCWCWSPYCQVCLCISEKISYLPARSSGRCIVEAVDFSLTNSKWSIFSWPPPQLLYLFFNFLFFLAKGFLAFRISTKEALGRKLFSIKCRQAEKRQFSERIFQWKVAIFCQRHLYSFTNYIKMSCLRSCSTSFLPQHFEWRLVGDQTLLVLLWSRIRTPMTKRQCCQLKISRSVPFHAELTCGLVQMTVWTVFFPFILYRLSSCLDADVSAEPRTLYDLHTCSVNRNLEKGGTQTGQNKWMNEALFSGRWFEAGDGWQYPSTMSWLPAWSRKTVGDWE